MTYRRHETIEEAPDTSRHSGADTYTHHTVYDPYEHRRASLYRWSQAIYLIFGIIEALIAIRFTLRLLGANEAAAFTDFVYDITAPFVAPFVGVFGTPQADGAVLEPHSLLAIAVYALLAWLLVRLMWVIGGETRHGVTRRSVSTEDAEEYHART